ncbi:MAG: GLPGLI family protein [Muribaculaceae bacterium]|nr:GLPGLI family protein [Muribaculaceae bacterium]
MKRAIIIIGLLIAACGALQAQPKQNGRIPTREKRGYDQRSVIDTAHVRVLYALNAKEIKDENTYIDLGKLEAGKNVHKYSSEFLNLSDQAAIRWKKEKGHTDNVPKSLWMGGQKEHQEHWSELVFSDYIIRDNHLTEYSAMPLWGERDNGRYTEEWPLMKWALEDETQTILGHKCQKATCRFRGRDFVAWFATDVPIKGGPWKFGGLPGCILKVYDKDKLYVWEAVAIERGTYPITVYSERFFPKASREHIYKLQKRYNENYWGTIGWTNEDGTTPGKSAFQPLEME